MSPTHSHESGDPSALYSVASGDPSPSTGQEGAHPAPSRRRVLVVGGGVVGLTAALRLARAGQDVTVIDDPQATFPGSLGPASLGNAGHIAVEQASPMASLSTLTTLPRRWYPLGGALDVRDPLALAPWVARFLAACRPQRFERGRVALSGLLAQAMPAWQALAASLEEPGLIQADGHLVVWESTGSARRGRRGWEADSGHARVGDLSAADQALVRRLAIPLAGGVRFHGTGRVSDLGRLVRTLAAALIAAGGAIQRQRVARLDRDGADACVVLADGRRLGGDVVLVAAGFGSAALLAGVGERAPLVAERGYHLHWSDHDWPVDAPPLVFEDRSLIITRFADGLRAASFVEFAPADTPADEGKWDRLRQHVAALGLPVRGEPRAWMGARPTLPDYLPAIGRAPTLDNLYYAFGHQHLGLTLAAVTADLVEGLVLGGGDADLSPFDLRRFDGAPV